MIYQWCLIIRSVPPFRVVNDGRTTTVLEPPDRRVRLELKPYLDSTFSPG